MPLLQSRNNTLEFFIFIFIFIFNDHKGIKIKIFHFPISSLINQNKGNIMLFYFSLSFPPHVHTHQPKFLFFHFKKNLSSLSQVQPICCRIVDNITDALTPSNLMSSGSIYPFDGDNWLDFPKKEPESDIYLALGV